MSDTTFAQHIITSSKLRRGFQTYQRTTGIVDDQLDHHLAQYGVYNASHYPDVEELKIEDYPVLFFFYQLKHHGTILCRSAYVGLDLHSYPPRAGNYLAHTLFALHSDQFNPVEVYDKMSWKSAHRIKADDESGVAVNFNLEVINFSVETSYFNPKYIRELFANNQRRLEMYRLAIQTILDGQQKLIIIDQKEQLINWTMTLLQSFPLPFIFDKVSITSFACSTILIDACNVLCFESFSREDALRYQKNAVIIDIEAESLSSNERTGEYAFALSTAVENDEFDSLKSFIFTKIADRKSYRQTDFNYYAKLYLGLLNAKDMDNSDFRLFVRDLLNYSLADIQLAFEKIALALQVDKCKIIWEEYFQRIQNNYQIKDHRDLIEYSFPPDTDAAWLDFEHKVISTKNFNSIDELAAFFSERPDLDKSRLYSEYFSRGLVIVGQINNYEHRVAALQELRLLLPKSMLNTEDDSKLETQINYYHFFQKLQKIPKTQQLFRLVTNNKIVNTPEKKNEVSRLIVALGWREIFEYLNKGEQEIIRKIYDLSGFNFDLPDKRLVFFLLDENAIPDQHVKDVLRLMSPSQKKELLQLSSDQRLIKLEVNESDICSLSRLDIALQYYSEVIPPTTLVQFFIDNSNTQEEELWDLLYLIYTEGKKSDNKYKYAREIDATSRTLVEKHLNGSRLEIPEKHLSIAIHLKKKGKLTRPIPQADMDINLQELAGVVSFAELKKVGHLIGNRKLTVDHLASLIRLPWDYITWSVFYDQLSIDQKISLPPALLSLIERSERSHQLLAPQVYNDIICELFIFLIYEGTRKLDLKFLLRNIELNWEEYEYVINRLNILVSEHKRKNKNGDTCYQMFANTSNKKTPFPLKNRPKWTFPDEQ